MSLLKIDNTSTNSITNFKGYVGKSVYKFYQNGLNNRVTELKKEKGRFDNIPLIYLNQILEEKKRHYQSFRKAKRNS